MGRVQDEILLVKKRSRRRLIIFVVIAGCALAGYLFYALHLRSNLIYQNTAIVDAIQEAEETKLLAQAEVKLMETVRDSLKVFQHELDSGITEFLAGKEVEELKEKNQGVARAIVNVNSELKDLVEVEQSQRGIRFYSYKPNDSLRRVMVKALKEDCKVKNYPEWEELPGFFSRKPTVLYYSDDTKVWASKVADQLSKISGSRFLITQGKGVGVAPSEINNTLIVHYSEISAEEP